MNDPHVVALVYRLDDSLRAVYRDAESLDHDHEAFRITSEGDRVRFEMKEHYASEAEARKVVDEFVRRWEFHADVERPFYKLRLSFDESEIVDRNPQPNVVSLSATSHIRVSGTARLTVEYPRYPSPPTAGFAMTPDVESMYHRYRMHVNGKEPLPSMAYFCLTVLEKSTRAKGGRRKAAGRKYGISEEVLKRIGRLTAYGGGTQARKASGRGSPLTSEEERFLIAAVRALILRVGEVADDPTRDRPVIELTDLP